MNPQYSDAYLACLYADYDAAVPGRGDGEPRRNDNFAHIERYVAPGRLLSIGSGSGAEIKTAQARGWSVEGYDVDAEKTEHLASTLGVRVYSGNILAAPLEPDSYDCVYMDQVLEHPKNPEDYLALAHRILRPSGVLYLGVPNIGSMASRYQTIVGKAGLKPRRGRHYDTWHHMFYYSPRVLRKLLEHRYGFRVLELQGDPVLADGMSQRVANALRRRIPWLDSSMRLVARPVKRTAR